MGFFSPNAQQVVESGLKAFHAASFQFDSYPFENFQQLLDFLGPDKVSEIEDTIALGDGLVDENDLISIFTDFANELEGRVPSLGTRGRKNPFNDLVVEFSLNPRGFQMFKFVSRGVSEDFIETVDEVGERSKSVFKAIGEGIEVTGLLTGVLLPVAAISLGFIWWKRLAKT